MLQAVLKCSNSDEISHFLLPSFRHISSPVITTGHTDSSSGFLPGDFWARPRDSENAKDYGGCHGCHGCHGRGRLWVWSLGHLANMLLHVQVLQPCATELNQVMSSPIVQNTTKYYKMMKNITKGLLQRHHELNSTNIFTDMNCLPTSSPLVLTSFTCHFV